MNLLFDTLDSMPPKIFEIQSVPAKRPFWLAVKQNYVFDPYTRNFYTGYLAQRSFWPFNKIMITALYT